MICTSFDGSARDGEEQREFIDNSPDINIKIDYTTRYNYSLPTFAFRKMLVPICVIIKHTPTSL